MNRYAVNRKLETISMEEIEKWKLSLNDQQKIFQKKKSANDSASSGSAALYLPNKIVSLQALKYSLIAIRLSGIDVGSFGVNEEAATQAAKKRKIAIKSADDELESFKNDNLSMFKSNKRADANGVNGHHANGSAATTTVNGVQINGAANGHSQASEEKKARFVPVVEEVWSSSQDDADGAFAQRANKGKVEVTYTPTEKVDEASFEMWDDVEASLKIQVDASSQMETFRFMGDGLEPKSNALESKLVNLGTRIIEEHRLPLPEMFHIIAQDPLVAMGRICPDQDGAFAEKSVVLEGDEDRTKARVLVDLKTVEKFALFPGQVVVMEGMNTTGKSLSISDCYEPNPLPLYRNLGFVPPRAYPYAPTSVLVAAGPFTTTENLAYRPLDHLLEVIESTNPQVVVLIGPFVDTAQALVQNSDETFIELFKSKVSATLTRAVGHTSSMHLAPSKFIIVPHPRDPDTHPLPQPPFSAKEYQLESKWITPVSNPCTMRINEFTLGVTSVDIIRHISSTEISRNVTGDRFSRLCGHLLKQQSYYPLFPASSEVNIEYSKLQGLELPYAPDILIVPSDLQHFVKNVNNTLFINPGRLSKGKTGGTFAKITIYPQSRATDEADDTQEDKENKDDNTTSDIQQTKGAKGGHIEVARRTKVEIVRI